MSLSELLTTADEIQELAILLEKEDCIAWDTEFIRESTFYPIFEILQVATRERSWLIDIQAFLKQSDSKEKMMPLLKVFQNPKVLKIVHAAQADQECLFTTFGVLAIPSFDTAVGAALSGYGQNLGLSKLLQLVLGIQLAKGHARTHWSVRPLPEQLKEYAHEDVRYLVALADVLMKQLTALGRKDWALQRSKAWEDSRLYQMDINAIVQKLAQSKRLDGKTYNVLKELVQWREQRVRSVNRPRRWVADDQVLLDLAKVKPKNLEHLKAFRGLNANEIKVSGSFILDVIQKGEDQSLMNEAPMQRAHVQSPSIHETQKLNLLRCYLSVLGEQNCIASEYLLTPVQMLALLRQGPASLQDLRDILMSDEIINLIGQELIDFLQGKKALRLSDQRLSILNLTCNQ